MRLIADHSLYNSNKPLLKERESDDEEPAAEPCRPPHQTPSDSSPSSGFRRGRNAWDYAAANPDPRVLTFLKENADPGRFKPVVNCLRENRSGPGCCPPKRRPDGRNTGCPETARPSRWAGRSGRSSSTGKEKRDGSSTKDPVRNKTNKRSRCPICWARLRLLAGE